MYTSEYDKFTSILINWHAPCTPSFSSLPHAGFFARPRCLFSHRCQSCSVTLFGFMAPNNPLLGRKSKLSSCPPPQRSHESLPTVCSQKTSLTCGRAWRPVSGVTRRDSSMYLLTAALFMCWINCSEAVLPVLRLLPACLKPVVYWDDWSRQWQSAPQGLEASQAPAGS